MSQIKPGSFAYARKRTKDNLIWIAIISLLLAAACSSCARNGATKNCRLTQGYVGYGSR